MELPLLWHRGQGWFLGFHVFTHYVKVTFFQGTSLWPVPPGGTSKDARGSTSRKRSRRGADDGVGEAGGRNTGLGNA